MSALRAYADPPDLRGSWAFSPADQTSPALAARAGALFDTTLASGRVTELRIHGVSGSNGPTMLEHPTALQVAGDTITGFYRRWNPDGGGRPSVGWKLEAYSWGGLTERPLASASWLVLAPFMIYNLAHFMLPAEPEKQRGQPEPEAEPELEAELKPGWRLQLARGVLRLLALAATLQFVTAAAAVTVSTVAWQAAGHPGVLPQWMAWYAHLPPGWRVAIALLSVGVVVAVLWVTSVVTANRYEARTSSGIGDGWGRWRLTEPGFWKGALLVSRQRVIHAAAALAAAALLVAWRAGDPAWAHQVVLVFSAVVLAVAAVVIALLRRPEFALLTLACPARRRYGRAFPAYFGRRYLEELRNLLTHDGRQYWRNAVRRTDYIGSWIFSPPSPLRTQAYLEEHFDQLCWDPVLLAPDAEPTPPPVHRHSGWWPDARAGEVATYLVDLLRSTQPVGPPLIPAGSAQQESPDDT